MNVDTYEAFSEDLDASGSVQDLYEQIETGIETQNPVVPKLTISGGPTLSDNDKQAIYEWPGDRASPFISVIINGAKHRLKVASYLGTSYELDFDGLIYTTTLQKDSAGNVEVIMTFKRETSILDDTFDNEPLPNGVIDLRTANIWRAGKQVKGYKQTIIGTDQMRFRPSLSHAGDDLFTIAWASNVLGRYDIGKRNSFHLNNYTPPFTFTTSSGDTKGIWTVSLDSKGILSVTVQLQAITMIDIYPPIMIAGKPVTAIERTISSTEPALQDLLTIEMEPGDTVVRIEDKKGFYRPDDGWFDVDLAKLIQAGYVIGEKNGVKYKVTPQIQNNVLVLEIVSYVP